MLVGRIRKLFKKKLEYENIIIRNEESDAAPDTASDEMCEIASDNHTEFWMLYCAAIHNGETSNIFQVPIDVMPVMLQVPRIEDPLVLVEKSQQYLYNKYLFDDLSVNSLVCVVTSGEFTTTLWYPYCRLSVEEFVDDDLPELARILGVEINTDIYTYGKPGISGVPLYGSNDEKFRSMYTDMMTETEEGDEVDDKDLMKRLDPESHSKVEQYVVDIEKLLADIPEKLHTGVYWLPMVLSVDYWKSITIRRPIKTDILPMITAGYTYDIGKINALESNIYDDDTNTLEMYWMFLKMWRPDTIINPKYWKLVGAAFYTLFDGHDRGLNGWVKTINDALAKTGKPSPLRVTNNLRRQCSLLYKGFKSGVRDAKTLAQIAAIESPDKYVAWHSRWVNEALAVSVDGSEDSIARVLYRLTWLEFFFVHVGDRVLGYQFGRGRLLRDHGFVSVRVAISGRLRRLYNNMRANISQQVNANPSLQAAGDQALDHVRKVIKRLGQRRPKNDIVYALAERANIPNLLDYIDMDPDLTLLGDGRVLVASANNVYDREGLVQDYVMKSFNARLDKDMSWHHPAVQDLLDFYFMLWIDEDTIHYQRKFFASLLRGGQQDKKFYFWLGPMGGNGKTATQKLIERACGSKSTSLPSNFLNSERGKPNEHNATECKVIGVRVAFIEEIEPNKQIMSSLLKSHSGGDTMNLRKPFGEEAFDADPQHKIVGVGNGEPMMRKEDALIERVVYIPFLTQFVYNPPKTPEERIKEKKFKRDIMFSQKIPALIDAWLWVAKQDYPKYIDEGMSKKSASSELYTTQYWISVDRFQMFIGENISKCTGANASVQAVCNRFVHWHQSSYRSLTPPDKPDIIKELSKHLEAPVAGAWADYSLRGQQEGGGKRQ